MGKIKIIARDNFNKDNFVETNVAENVNSTIGQKMVDLYNGEHWSENSKIYLELIEDDYILYEGAQPI